VTAYVIDASVAVKWFFEEEHTVAARALLDDASLQRLAPDFILVEATNTAWKRARRGEITQDYARRLPRRLRTMLSLQQTSPLIAPALELALTFDRSVYDSLYVVLAMMRDCQLMTADRKLYNALHRALPGALLWIEHVA